MGIYIKDMEMPKEQDVFIRIDKFGEVYIYGSYPTELHKAIEIPPHGPLIDIDQLIKHCVWIPRDGGYLPAIYMSYVKNAPIVIPKEEQ